MTDYALANALHVNEIQSLVNRMNLANRELIELESKKRAAQKRLDEARTELHLLTSGGGKVATITATSRTLSVRRVIRKSRQIGRAHV